MKRIVVSILVSLLSCSFLWGQVQFKVADGMEEGKLKQTVESSLSTLLTEINNACEGNRALNMGILSMTNEAKLSLSMLWENVPFLCTDPVVVERVLMTPAGGYQVRNIPIELVPLDGKDVADDLDQEAVVEFDGRGRIVSFYFGLGVTKYRQVMKAGTKVTDARRRMMILDYVEHFRTAYNQHDINFIRQVFSEDAIIITGKVVQTRKSDVNPYGNVKVEYVVKNKKEYIAALERVFANNKYINVVFEDIRLASHPTKKDFYGVTLKQDYTSSTYSDEGYLFLLWDFRDETHPQIHVRTWQPYWLDDKHEKALPEDDVYDLSSFDLSKFDY